MKKNALIWALCVANAQGAFLMVNDETEFLNQLEETPSLESFENFDIRVEGMRVNFDINRLEAEDIVITSTERLMQIDDPVQSNFPTDGNQVLLYLGEVRGEVTLMFDFAVGAVGFYLWNFGDDGGRRLDLIADTGEMESYFPPIREGDPLVFIGLISETPFDTLTLRQDNTQSYGIDSLYYLPVNIPEPSVAMLLMVGAFSLVSRRR